MRISDFGNAAPPRPAHEAGGPQDAPPPNYLVWAILSTVLCFPPLGVPAIMFSAQVNSKWAAGDFAGSRDASAKARKFARWAVAAAAAALVVLAVVLGFWA
jgi:Interferon-induced transmembrane protein